MGRILALSAFLAFITIQIAPLWAKLDYSKADIPCPIHAMQAKQAALYAKHQKRSHEKYTALVTYLGQDDHAAHHDPDMICLPGMGESHTEPRLHHDHANRDNSHEPDEDQQNNPWACPYCAVKEMAFTIMDDFSVKAPQLKTASVRYFSYISEPAKISAVRVYQARAPPAFS